MPARIFRPALQTSHKFSTEQLSQPLPHGLQLLSDARKLPMEHDATQVLSKSEETPRSQDVHAFAPEPMQLSQEGSQSEHGSGSHELWTESNMKPSGQSPVMHTPLWNFPPLAQTTQSVLAGPTHELQVLSQVLHVPSPAKP